jgi:UrcA family protein
VPSVAVHTTGIDLGTDAGAEMLYQRIVGAAHSVCPRADSRDLAAYGAERACERAAIERAVEAVHSDKLVQVAASHPPRIG